MPETLDTTDPNIVAVQTQGRGSRQRIVNESDEFSNPRDKNLESALCFRESNELFHDRRIQRQRIDQLVNLFVQEPIMSDVEMEYILGNVKSRLTYLKNTEFAPIDRSINGETRSKGFPMERLLKWEQKKHIFSVCIGNDKFFPAFQFAGTEPRSIIEKVIQLLPDYMHGWHIAYWFSGSNGWLNGDSPKDLLHLDKKIIYAAKQVSLDKCRF